VRHKARKYFEDKGYKLTFGKYIDEMDEFGSTSVEHRLEDLHDAFADPAVKLILCARGGFNGNSRVVTAARIPLRSLLRTRRVDGRLRPIHWHRSGAR
jgi:hypothetical protein